MLTKVDNADFFVHEVALPRGGSGRRQTPTSLRYLPDLVIIQFPPALLPDAGMEVSIQATPLDKDKNNDPRTEYRAFQDRKKEEEEQQQQQVFRAVVLPLLITQTVIFANSARLSAYLTFV
ncbi:hypothetical protein GGE65_008410 [Skermanella aerolata]|uniref:hypothetical protein n=1 Tax=Skermanella aerolata TaxID=393310 RepID=UPI003D1D312E